MAPRGTDGHFTYLSPIYRGSKSPKFGLSPIYRGSKSPKFGLHFRPQSFWVVFVSKQSNVSLSEIFFDEQQCPPVWYGSVCLTLRTTDYNVVSWKRGRTHFVESSKLGRNFVCG